MRHQRWAGVGKRVLTGVMTGALVFSSMPVSAIAAELQSGDSAQEQPVAQAETNADEAAQADGTQGNQGVATGAAESGTASADGAASTTASTEKDAGEQPATADAAASEEDAAADSAASDEDAADAATSDATDATSESATDAASDAAAESESAANVENGSAPSVQLLADLPSNPENTAPYSAADLKPGTYALTANASMTALGLIWAHASNPNNPFNYPSSNASKPVEAKVPTEPRTDKNATLEVTENGEYYLTINFENPAFLVEKLGTATNATVVDQQTVELEGPKDKVDASPYTTRISQATIKLEDHSGEYTLANGMQYALPLNSPQPYPLIIRADLANAELKSTPTTKVAVPQAQTGLTYTGTEQTGVVGGTGYTLSGSAKATDAGTYSATAKLASGYEWADGTTEPKTVTWSIAKAKLTPLGDREEAAFVDVTTIDQRLDGNVQSGWTGFVNGETAATAKDFRLPQPVYDKASLRPGNTYTFDKYDSGSARNYEFEVPSDWTYTIRYDYVLLNAYSLESLRSAYTGSEQSLADVVTDADADVAAHAKLSGDTTATDAGDYTATVTPDYGYAWRDGTGAFTNADPLQVEWHVSKGLITISFGVMANGKIQPETIEQNGTPQFPVYVTGLKGSDTLESLGYHVEWEGVPARDANGLLPEGDYTISAKGGIVDNSLKNYGVFRMSGKLHVGALTEVAVPVPATGLAYTGAEQTGVAEGTGYTLSGTTKATDAGTYTATATLESGYKWADGTTAPKTLEWSISKVKLTFQGGRATSATVDVTDIDKQLDGDVWSKWTGFVNGEDEATAADFKTPQPVYNKADLKPGNTYTIDKYDAGSARNYEFEVPAGWTYTIQYDYVLLNAYSLESLRVSYDTTEHNLADLVSKADAGVAAHAKLAGDTAASDAGTYTATLTPDYGYAWRDKSGKLTNADPLTVSWRIDKGLITLFYGAEGTTDSGETITQDATPQFPVRAAGLKGSDTLESLGYHVEWEGVPARDANGLLPVGDYKLSAKGGMVDNSPKNYSVMRMGGTLHVTESASVEAPVALAGLTYTGAEQTGVVAASGATTTAETDRGYTLSGDYKAKNAGTYTATATLTPGHKWADGTTAPKTVTWSIAKAPLTATYVSETVQFGDAPAYVVKVEGFVGGETAETAAGYVAPTVSSEDLALGEHSLTPQGGSADNYTFASYAGGTLTVVEKRVSKPVAATGLKANGSEQVGVAEGEGYVLTGDPKATEAGTYTVTATLKEGYVWSDGTTEPVTLTWTLAKADEQPNPGPGEGEKDGDTSDDAADDASEKELPQTGDATSVAAMVSTAVAGLALAAGGWVSRRKNQR